ncbi:MAG: GTPase/DUF3482 domain-containing protein [Pseudomonadales bacterium]|nr:GTPase/DUF3482 domain-containing protein [Pseudomonadales bacterium]
MDDIPRFAITGHPNKGKSSIVATLAEDAKVGISDLPGTTTQARVYPMRIDGQILYELIDTPGFQRAREMLEWLKARETSVVNRYQAILEFQKQYSEDPHFHDECQILKPIMGGAGILYVVDGGRPYGPEYECEMQILQWTGQPRMALINLIGGEDYVDDWRRALDQYFSIVRVFDAQRADFSKRIDLLRAFQSLEESWSTSIGVAVDVLLENRVQRQNRSVREIANFLVDVMCMQESVALKDDKVDVATEQKLLQRLQGKIRRREQQTYNTIQQICGYAELERHIEQVEILNEDLFSARSFKLFGLSNSQLALTGAASGAAAGGGLDVLTGGTSLFMGAGLGALFGGIGAVFSARRIAEVQVFGNAMGGYEYRVGPVAKPNFPWVVLGRVVLFYKLISERNHARRDALLIDVGSANNFSESIGLQQRQAFNRIFKMLREHRVIDAKSMEKLTQLLVVLCK